MDQLFLVMPAYNEEKNIVPVVSEWYKTLEAGRIDFQLIVADGGSSDNTLKLLYELQKEYPRLEIFEKPGTDHGTKLMFLYQHAVQNGADYIFQTDSDGQTKPEEFKKFWRLRKKYDAVIGCRLHREDGKMRIFVENVLRIFLWIFFNAKVPDANAPFRLMKAGLVHKYLKRLPEDFNLPNAVLTAYFVRFHENVKFVSITFRSRREGANYMNLKRIMKIGWDSLENFRRLRRQL